MGIEIHYEFLFNGTKQELDAALDKVKQDVGKFEIPLILPISEHDGSGEVGFHFVIEHDPNEFPPADANPLGKDIFILSDATTLSLGFKPITPRVWTCVDSIKTSAAEYPVAVHNKACDIIDVLAKHFTAEINDETGFYVSRDMTSLTKQHEAFDTLMGEAASLLKDSLENNPGAFFNSISKISSAQPATPNTPEFPINARGGNHAAKVAAGGDSSDLYHGSSAAKDGYRMWDGNVAVVHMTIGDKRYLVGTSTLVEITGIHRGEYGHRKHKHGLMATARVVRPAAQSKYKVGDQIPARPIRAFTTTIKR